MFGIDTIKKLLAGKDLENAAEKVNWNGLLGKGWKTYTGAAIFAVAAFLQAIGCDCQDFLNALQKFGMVLGLIGIRHAIATSSADQSKRGPELTD